MKKKNSLFNDDDLIHAEVANDLLETMNEEVVKPEDEIYELKHQLAEKDKEIERLNGLIKLWVGCHDIKTLENFRLQDEIKEIRHQVCEEIREIVKEITKIGNSYRSWFEIQTDDFLDMLDQIEQGASKC